MKVYNKPISVVSITDFEGNITPVKWKIETNDGEMVIYKITHIFNVDKRRSLGKESIVFSCMTILNSIEKSCKIQYRSDETTWFLLSIK